MDGIILQINPAWEEKYNCVCNELEHSHYLEWVHPDDQESSLDFLQQLLTTKSKQTFANRWRDCGNHYHWLSWEISVATPKKGKMLLYAVATDITAQKQAEKCLRDTEERFELAIRGSNHGLWDWNLKTNEIYLSPRWKNMLGYEDHEIANHLDEWIRFIHPDDFTKMWNTIETYLDRKIPRYESIYRVYHQDGNYRWVLARAAALWDEDEQPYRMVGTYTDITQNKHLEQALQENEALLAAVFNVTKIGICVTNEAGIFVRVNPAYCELYGYTLEELLGQHFTHILPTVKHEKALQLHRALFAGTPQVETEGEWQVQNRYGDSVDVSFTMGVFTQPDGHRFRVTTITDITKRKHDEAERYRLFNFSLDMQSIISFDVAFVEVNAAWERTLGWNKGELLEKSPLSFIHADDKVNSQKIFRQLLKGESISGLENRCLCKNGTYKWLSWNIYPLVDQQTMYVVTRDITERKRAEEEIQRQQAFIRLVVDSVPNLIFIKDQFSNFIFVNQAVANLLDITIGELLNQQRVEPCHSLERMEELYSKNERQVIESLSEIMAEESCYNANGEKLHFQMIKKPFVQSNGEVLVLSVGTDITERKHQECALKLNEARYRAIVQDQTDLICRFLPDGTLTFVNQAFANYFGKTESELLAQPALPSSILQHKQRLEQTIPLTPTNPVISGEYQTVLPDGKVCWQQWIDRAMFDNQKNIIEYQSVGRDITERKQAEEALRQSEQRLRVVTSAAPVILFALDSHQIFTFARGKALSLFNFKDDELVGQSVLDKFAFFAKAEDIQRAFAGETVTSLIALPNLVLETTLTPLTDWQQVTGVIGVSIDITKRHTLELKLKDAVAELETILNNSIMGIAYLKNGVFVRVNNKLENLLGYAHNELCGLPFSMIYPAFDDYQRMEQRSSPLFKQGKEYDAEQLLRSKEGKIFWARLVGKAVDTRNVEKGTIWIIEDITMQKEAQQHLRLTATVFETSANAIIVTDMNNRIQRVNPAFTKITGFTFAEVQGRKTSCLSSGQHDKAFYSNMWQTIQQSGHWQGEVWNRKKTGEIYVAWLSISAITNEEGIPTQYMAVLTDISSLQEHIENVRYLANYDSLTKLPNRLLFHDNLLQAKALAKRNNAMFALLFIDLDGFKPVNDTLGHAIGDQLLQGVAKRLQDCVRKNDTVARLGGDEFTIILNHIRKPQDAAKVAETLVQHLQQPFQLGEHNVIIAASIGISLYPYDSKDVDHLIKQADTAMYEAKHSGKGRYCFYEAAI
jgi:diguanylate cyclase (GGDEF)-like protein/PAS domain S-box-containing protein